MAMRAALAAHDEVLREAIEAHGGLLFKHTGDGVCAAFASPRSAVDAAVAAQRALELPVRMGMATGEAELRDGDYFGAVLNRAARVMAAGHGGQILLAESTRCCSAELIWSIWGRGGCVMCRRRSGCSRSGRRAAHGVSARCGRWIRRPGNLRPAATSFIGRESEVGEMQAAVKAHRLVTLTGVGGVGKTRLAIEVAARLADEFPDGVWVFELAAVTDPAAVPDAVAAVLGITQQPGKSVSESVAAALEGRVRLLVFDNCEHVLRRRRRSDRGDPGALGDGEDLGHQPRRTGGRRRAVVAGALAGRRRGNRLCRGDPVRRTRPQRGAALLGGQGRRGGRGGGDLPSPRRDPVGHRVGGLADGVDDRERGA